MELVKELFKDNDKYIFLANAESGLRCQAVSLDHIMEAIFMADEGLFPEDLVVEDGRVVAGTGMFMQADFSTRDGKVDYCFQDGSDGCGRPVSTLVRVTNKGIADPYYPLFLRHNQVINQEGELLEACYLATYQDGFWYILNKKDRDAKLDCESEEVLSRARKVTF